MNSAQSFWLVNAGVISFALLFSCGSDSSSNTNDSGAAGAGAGGVAGNVNPGGTAGTDSQAGQAGQAGSAPYPYQPGKWNSSYRHSWQSGKLSCSMSPAEIVAADTAKATVGPTTIATGWSQVSSNNQDPFLARVDNGALTWCVAVESAPPDGRAYGIAWDGADNLYGVYSVVGGGTQLDGHGGWMPAYGSAGSGGGKTVGVIAKFNPQDGSILASTFIPSELASAKKINTHSPRDFTMLEDGTIEYLGNPAFAPLNPDGSLMCAGGSEYPNGYRGIFSADLKQLLCAQTESCGNVITPCK